MQEKALQLVSLEQAKKLKELGFDWEVIFNYSKKFGSDEITLFSIEFSNDYNTDYGEYTYSAPSVTLALKWFRDEKGLNNYVILDGAIGCGGYEIIRYKIGNILEFKEFCFSDKHYKRIQNKKWEDVFNSYEEAESALLDALIEYYENNKEEK